MKQVQLDGFRYYLLPSTNPPENLVPLHNSAYQLWKQVWTETFQQLKIETTILEDEFARQDIIACIAKDDVPVAIHLYSFFSSDCNAARAQTYMRQYPEIFFAKLKKLGVRDVMSLEYMTVNPDWRKGKFPIHMGAVLVGLSNKVMLHLGAHASIAPARRDHKVHDIAYAFGGEPIISNVINHNVPCDLLAILAPRIKRHENNDIEAMIGYLWANHQETFATQPLASVHRLPQKLRKIA